MVPFAASPPGSRRSNTGGSTTIQSRVPTVYLSPPRSTRPGWRTCCPTLITSSRSAPSTGPAWDLPGNIARCSRRDRVRESRILQKHHADAVPVASLFLFPAPPEPPRMWRYISWTGKWLYVWWDHIQYDWFGNISFPLYYKVSAE